MQSFGIAFPVNDTPFASKRLQQPIQPQETPLSHTDHTKTMTTHPIIQTLTDKITSELRPVDREAAFDEYLNTQGPVRVAGMTFNPADIIKGMDPTAYRCWVNDYADGEPWVEIDGETYDQREVEELVREFREELESELSDLEAELEEAQEEDEPDHQDVKRLERAIAEKQAEIDAIAADDFFN